MKKENTWKMTPERKLEAEFNGQVFMRRMAMCACMITAPFGLLTADPIFLFVGAVSGIFWATFAIKVAKTRWLATRRGLTLVVEE